MQNNMPLARLIGNEGSNEEIHYELTGSETNLGRGSDCDIQLDDPQVSRHHAVIRFLEGRFFIKDLGSSNGTFVNKELVSLNPLDNGDLIQVGDTLLRIRLLGDPDATIIQSISPPQAQSVATTSVTLPRDLSTGQCQKCGRVNPPIGKFCHDCGAPLPQLPESFLNTLKTYAESQAAFSAGQISREEYRAALKELVVQDDQGEYWMLGIESGEWYWYDGEEWKPRTPKLILPGAEKLSPKQTPAAQKREGEEPIPQAPSTRGRWGAIGLWLISALIVLGFGIYTIIELISFNRSRQEAQIAPLSPGITEEELTSSTVDSTRDDELSSTTEDESGITGEAETPFEETEITGNGFRLRSYYPTEDESLQSLTLEAAFLEDQSTEELSYHEGYFPADTPGLLVMGWCAIDQVTLESNLAAIKIEGNFDGTAIPQTLWTQEISQEEGMFCGFYRAVVEDLAPGFHHYSWSTSYQEPIFDGWETFPPGTYTREYVIEIPAGYTFVDDFESSIDHWGETTLDEVKVWIEAGNLHIELYQASIGAWSSFRDRDFEDFMIITQARSLSDNPGYYGVVFRQQDANNYYFFEITEEGSYRLGKRVDGEIVDLIPWTPSEAILGNGEVNRLAVSMEGDWILALINGELAADLNDSSLKNGNLGLLAGTTTGVNTFHAAFQQVSIDAPE
jgi:pSer/pThr/pTyr-binding forkhead associated (FHA) protein